MSKKSNVALQAEIEIEIEPAVAIEESKNEIVQEAIVEEPVKEEPKTLEQFLAMGELPLIAHFGNKSKTIRALALMGAKCGPISRALDIKFQHARNVLNKPLKRLIKEERDAAKNGADHVLSHEE